MNSVDLIKELSELNNDSENANKTVKFRHDLIVPFESRTQRNFNIDITSVTVENKFIILESK